MAWHVACLVWLTDLCGLACCLSCTSAWRCLSCTSAWRCLSCTSAWRCLSCTGEHLTTGSPRHWRVTSFSGAVGHVLPLSGLTGGSRHSVMLWGTSYPCLNLLAGHVIQWCCGARPTPVWTSWRVTSFSGAVGHVLPLSGLPGGSRHSVVLWGTSYPCLDLLAGHVIQWCCGARPTPVWTYWRVPSFSGAVGHVLPLSGLTGGSRHSVVLWGTSYPCLDLLAGHVIQWCCGARPTPVWTYWRVTSFSGAVGHALPLSGVTGGSRHSVVLWGTPYPCLELLAGHVIQWCCGARPTPVRPQ